MEARILQRNRLPQLLEVLIRDNEVIAPRDEVSFGVVGSAQQVRLDDDKPAKSLKEFFLPMREELLRYRAGERGLELSSVASPGGAERIIFGARPCDVAALPIVDKVFAWEVVDPLYLERRRSTTIVSLACERPCKSCFCVSLGGSPAGTRGTDLLLTPLRDVYHVQIVSEQGQALGDRYEDLFDDADESHDRERELAESEFQRRISKQVDVEGLAESMSFENPVWQDVAQECVDCGICTFLCPTCHCFDIQDEGGPSEGARVRLWDSCAFRAFSKTAVHEPRATHYSRYRQRIMHKFQYYPQNFGEILCVGCGRCIQHCPVSVDITQVLEAVRE